MKLGATLLRILDKTYEGNSLTSMKYKTYDLAIKADGEGNPVLLFMGKMNEHGKVKGFRYARTLKKDHDGMVIKDHWELKGRSS